MKWILALVAIFSALIAGALIYIFLGLAPGLPALDAITDYQPKIPLRIYTADNALIGECGEEHRDFVPIKEIPDVLKNASMCRRFRWWVSSRCVNDYDASSEKFFLIARKNRHT